MIKPILIFAYGNLSRGDDALAPLLIECLEIHLKTDLSLLSKIELLVDFQLHIEHIFDLKDRELVIFIDASVNQQELIQFNSIQPNSQYYHSTHVMSPQTLMYIFQTIENEQAPVCFLLTLKGESFELGDGLSAAALNSLNAAEIFLINFLKQQ